MICTNEFKNVSVKMQCEEPALFMYYTVLAGVPVIDAQLAG